MLRNSKPLIERLTQEQADRLNDLKFHIDVMDSQDKLIAGDERLSKSYAMGGGIIRLEINLGNCYGSVRIATPYDQWWRNRWLISKFTKELDDFQKRLKSDLSELRKLGIIS